MPLSTTNTLTQVAARSVAIRAEIAQLDALLAALKLGNRASASA